MNRAGRRRNRPHRNREQQRKDQRLDRKFQTTFRCEEISSKSTDRSPVCRGSVSLTFNDCSLNPDYAHE
jgi:hypothetical protein